jgi:hypothetical protein
MNSLDRKLDEDDQEISKFIGLTQDKKGIDALIFRFSKHE